MKDRYCVCCGNAFTTDHPGEIECGWCESWDKDIDEGEAEYNNHTSPWGD